MYLIIALIFTVWFEPLSPSSAWFRTASRRFLTEFWLNSNDFCSLPPYNLSKLVRRTRDLATSLEEDKFLLFSIKTRKFICLHLPENSSKDRGLYFTQIAQFIIYSFFIDLTKKFIVKNPGGISLQFVWTLEVPIVESKKGSANLG